MTLAHRHIWFGKKKDKRMGDEESLIPEWPSGHLWQGAKAVLSSITKGKSYPMEPVQWLIPVVPALWETEGEGSLESRILRPFWAT